jgi:hypothetical protein
MTGGNEDGSRDLKQPGEHSSEVGFNDFTSCSLCCFADRRPVVRTLAGIWHVRKCPRWCLRGELIIL